MLRLASGANIFGSITTTPTAVYTADKITQLTELHLNQAAAVTQVEAWVETAAGDDELFLANKYLRPNDEQVLFPSIKLAIGDKLKLCATSTQGKYRLSYLKFEG